MTDQPAPACGEECAEGHTYTGRCTQTCTHRCTCGHPQHDHSTSGYCNACEDHCDDNDGHYPDDCDARTTPDTPAASSDETDNPLREQYAAVIEEELEQFFRDHPEEPRNSPWVLGMKDAAAAVRAAPAALDGPADTSTPAEAPAVDTCRPVQVGGETIRVHGTRPLAGLELGYAAEIVAAARRKLAAEPPVVPDDDGTESALTRRIRAQQRGLVLPAVEPPDGSAPPVPCPACTRARARGFTVDALAHPGCADALARKEASR
jgi:hypothetical protein